MHPRPEDVGALIAEVAATEILPRFRNLAPDNVIEKSAGELVTVADRAAEQRLTDGLASLLPGSSVVGEEAVAADPRLLQRLLGENWVWIVDPIDGTTNFIDGSPNFGVMVCLARKGELAAGWIYRPVGGITAAAEAGGGTWIGGRRLRLSECPTDAAGMTGTIHAGSYGDGSFNKRLQQRRNRVRAARSSRSAAIEYLRLAEGELHFTLFTKLMPWDHAAGVLLHREAGGHCGYLDGGDAYVPADIRRPGILLAPNREAWDKLHLTLLADGPR
jgi:fructose-1,6-bisphosphatase/inositol monophosphatase family enzyme